MRVYWIFHCRGVWPFKGSGSNGFNMNFIIKLWDIVDRISQVWWWIFFSSGCLDKCFNMTWVTLIPKFEEAREMNEFKPISMVGCVYKVIAKIFAWRICNVMGGLVGEVQTAFIQDRKILDGALITCESMHWLKKTCKQGVILKLDFKKCHNVLEGCFNER